MPNNDSNNDNNKDTSNDIPEFTLVLISGLQSEAGKPLNGAYGVTMKKKLENGRYPVAIYCMGNALESDATHESEEAGANLQPLQLPKEKSIKESNLSVRKDQDCFWLKNIVEHYLLQFQQPRKPKALLFWLKLRYVKWPEDYTHGLAYASNLRAESSDYLKEAWDIMKELDIPKDCDNPQVFYDLATTCFGGGGTKEEALDWALKIPCDTVQSKAMSKHALNKLSEQIRLLPENEISDKERCEFLVRVSKATHERDPSDHNALWDWGVSECRLGNAKEGALLYRKVLATKKLSDTDTQTLRKDLSLAQMQCVGGRLENYRILSTENWVATAIHNDYAGDYEIQTVNVGARVSGVVRAGPKGLQVEKINLPDPDDFEAFGKADFCRTIDG